MILFGNSLNSSVRKALCCAALRNVTLEHISVLRSSDDPVFRAVSPAGIIPALRDGQVTVMGAVPVIDYLDSVGDADPMIPVDRPARVQELSIAQIADGPLAQTMSTIFQNSVFLPRFLGKPGNTQLISRVARGPLAKVMGLTEAAVLNIMSNEERICYAEVAVFSQCISLPMSGYSIDGDRYPAIHALMLRMMADPALSPLITRDALLIGTDRDALTSLLREPPKKAIVSKVA